MATEQKPLKERIAALKAKRSAISREAKVRVASAFTIAKSMLPTGTTPEVIGKVAEALLSVPDTKILAAAVKQTAVNRFYTHVAEQMSAVHKIEMNDLLEKPEVLAKLKSEVESELKGGAKSASTDKKADDRSECGTQPETYTDPSIGITPAEMDASKAADREEDTVNKSLGDKKAAVAKAACSCGKEGCGDCKKAAADKKDEKTATAKKADDMPPAEAPAEEAAAPAAEEAPLGDAPAEDAPIGDATPETEGEIVIDNEKKEEIKEQIDAARNAIETLQTEIDDAANVDGEELLELAEGGEPLDEAENDIELGDDALDLENIFSDENMNEHKGALANEDEHQASAEEITFDNEPTSAETMEAALEGGEEVGSAADFFASEDGADSGMDFLMASAKEASGDDVNSRLKDSTVVKPGQLVDEFQADELGGEEVDAEADHDEDIFGDVLKTLKTEDYSVGKPRETEPDMKQPEPVKGGKVSSKTATASKPIRRLKVSAPVTQKEASALSSLLFTDEEDYR